MKNKILKWLTESVKMKFQTEAIENELRDGVLLFKLLNHYGVVNEKVFKHILPSDNPKVCENNLRELAVWFSLLGIKFGEAIISDIVKGRTKTCLKLLNELYVALHDKKHLHFDELDRHKTMVTSGMECVCCSFDHIVDFLKNQVDEEEEEEEELDESVVDEAAWDETVLDEAVLDESMLDESAIEKEPLCVFTSRNDEESSPYKKGTLYDRIRTEDIHFIRNELKKSARKLAKKKDRIIKDNTEEEEEEMTIEETMVASDSAANTTKTAKDSTTLENVTQSSEEDTERDQLRTLMLENITQKSEYEKQLALDTLKSVYQGKIDKKRLAGVQKTVTEEPKGYANFFSSCKTSEEEIKVQLEAIDKVELHRKLYDEKIRKRNKARLLRCKQIVQDVVVLAMKISEYGKKAVTNNLKMQWKQSLILGESILQDPDEASGKEMSVINVDGKCSGDETVNDFDFDNYNHLIGDWFSQSGPDTTYDDLYILAYIVHRLQKSRFPPVISLKPADLYRYRITSVLNGTLDELTIIKLKCLLVKSKICIVDISSAVEFCVSQYKLEANIKPPETPGKKNKKEKPKTAATNKSKAGKKTPEPVITRQDKEVQTTPSVFEDIDKPKELSRIAQIGREIYNIVQAPQTTADIPTEYVIDAVVEFLKFQKNIEGWVLVNFPSTLQEAYYLEKAFSGKTFPKVFNFSENREDDLEEELEEQEEIPLDRTTHSKLVHLPAKKPDVFITYFTSFINVIKEETLSGLGNNANILKDSESHHAKQEEEVSEEGEEEDILDLTTIYRNQGVLREFLYETLNFNALKELARVILQRDSDVTKVPSIEVFGEEVIKFYEKPSTVETPKQSPKKTANKKPAKGKDELTVTKEFLEQLMTAGQTAPPVEPDSQLGEESQMTTEETESETFVFPGQEGWSYAQFPMFKEDELALSNLWEEIEADYIKRIEHVLRVNRKNEELTTPYLNFIARAMNDVHDTENHHEKIVKDFLQYFNSAIEKRNDTDTAEKISNGLFNIEKRLWEISEKSRNDLEMKRRHAIDQNWTADRMIEIAKDYISLMEIEFNRCNSTLHFLYKYYSFMCGVQSSNHMPSVQPNCFARDWDECEIRSTIAKKLTDKKEVNVLNPLCTILGNADRHYISEMKLLKSDNDYFVDTYQDFVITHKNEYQARKKEEDTKNIMQFKKPKTVSEENDEGIPAVLQAEDDDLLNMFLEWRAAVKSELDRATWRIKIIKEKSFEILNNLETLVADVFYEHYDKNIASYYKENECIDNLCKLFNSAINAGSPVTGNVIAEGNCIYIYKEITDSPNLADLGKTIEDEMSSISFTVEQLYVIAKHLQSASTEGIIRKLAMRYLIEDMIFVEQCPENIPLFPESWNNLCPAELKLLLQDAFGASSKLHWKDFILYCLDLPFPDIEDIVEHKNKFRLYDKEHKGTVSYNEYSSIKFWFQFARDYIERADYYKSVKEFLFSLFKINDDEFDYMDFLLSFSKGDTPASGFGKALTSLSGRAIIISNKLAHLGLILTEYNEMLNKMVKEILKEIVTNAVEEVSGVKIEELVEEETEEEGSFETSRSSEIEHEYEDTTSNVDKQSQTVSLTEIMYDEYIIKNKLLQWTKKIPVGLIYSLLENRVYRALEFQDDLINADDIKRDIKESIARLEVDGEIDVPSLLEDLPFYSLFLYTYCFQIFSFSSAVKGESKCSKRF